MRVFRNYPTGMIRSNNAQDPGAAVSQEDGVKATEDKVEADSTQVSFGVVTTPDAARQTTPESDPSAVVVNTPATEQIVASEEAQTRNERRDYPLKGGYIMAVRPDEFSIRRGSATKGSEPPDFPFEHRIEVSPEVQYLLTLVRVSPESSAVSTEPITIAAEQEEGEGGLTE